MAPVTRMELRHDAATEGGDLVHTVELAGVPSRVPGPRRLVWRMAGRADLRPPPVLDGFAWVVAHQLAPAGGELRVRGAMSRKGLLNVHRLLELRLATSPTLFAALRVVPDEVVDLPAPRADDLRAVLAFSGGVDSTHAAVRHGLERGRPDALDLRRLVMVLGMDVRSGRRAAFAGMLRRAQPLADRLGVPLQAVETNSKDLSWELWPQTSAPVAASALSLFWQEARFGIFGGGLPYGANFLPLGHQPLFDQLCSGDAFTLVTDAAGLMRRQKLAGAARVPEALTGLRVCWEGADPSKNCGRCQRCLQTMINLKGAGLDAEGAFEAPFSADRLRETGPRTLFQARDLAEYSWRELRDAPAGLEAEAAAVRDALARVPPLPARAGIGRVAALLAPGLAERARRARADGLAAARRARALGRRAGAALRGRAGGPPP